MTRRPLRSTLILAFTLLAAAVALAACGSSGATPGDTENGGTGGAVKTYTDSGYGYSFQYPEGWELQEGDRSEVTAGGSAVGSVGVFDPEGAMVGDIYIDLAQVSVYELNVTVDDSMMDDIKTEVESILASLESQAVDMKTVDSLSETTVGTMDGYKVTYSFDKDGIPATSTLYFLFSGNREYQVTVQAATENWKADQAIFEALVESFKPGTAK